MFEKAIMFSIRARVILLPDKLKPNCLSLSIDIIDQFQQDRKLVSIQSMLSKMMPFACMHLLYGSFSPLLYFHTIVSLLVIVNDTLFSLLPTTIFLFEFIFDFFCMFILFSYILPALQNRTLLDNSGKCNLVQLII